MGAARGRRPRRALAEGTGLRVAEIAYRGAVRHVFTHRDVTAELFRVAVAAPVSGVALSDSQRWVSPDGLAALGVSSFARKTVRAGLGL